MICSEGLRAIKGTLVEDAEVKFKEGDGLPGLPAETTDKIIIAADNGRFYTVSADKLPGGRGWVSRSPRWLISALMPRLSISSRRVISAFCGIRYRLRLCHRCHR